MASRKRNHYIPKLLFKRFASKAMEGKSWVFQIDKSGKVTEPSTVDVGNEKYFYGKPETGVEDRLGAEETAFSEVLKKISNGTDPNRLSGDLRKHFWQMVIRTKALREQFSETATNLVDGLLTEFGTQKRALELAKNVRKNFKAMIRAEAKKLPRPQRARFLQEAMVPGRKEILIQKMVAELPQSMSVMKQMWERTGKDRMVKSAKDGQIRAIGKVLSENILPDSFNPKIWLLITSNSTDIVLGDVGVFARDTEGNTGPFMTFGNKWDQVYLPISRTEVLVASKSSSSIFLTSSEINETSARLSSRFIYSAVDTPEVRALIPLIGADAALLSDDDISELIESGMSELATNADLLRKDTTKK
ncbi:MAG: DUF4238 domain-containing protein [Alphaproteobacteria bacterium]|nr:DUF4238 domain-containing protein [Alphaproteobacteria bacterium]